MGSDQQKPKQQESQQILGMDQQYLQQKQSQQMIGNTKKNFGINVFNYEKFSSIMRQGLQNQEDDYENSKCKLNQYKCMILNHKNKQIEGICVNEECKAQNRRTCFDFIIQRIHDNDKKKINIANLQMPIRFRVQYYLLFLNQQIDYLKYCFYFEQLELTNENEQQIDCIKLKELEQIDIQLRQLYTTKNSINIKEYIQLNIMKIQVYLTFFQIIIRVYQQSILIYMSLNDQYQFKKDVKNSQNFIIKCNFILIRFKKMIIILQKIQNLLLKKTCYNTKLQKSIQIVLLKAQQNKRGDKDIDKRSYLKINKEIQKLGNFSDLQININQLYNIMEGLSFQNLQRYEEATQMYDKVIQLNLQDSVFYKNKGLSLLSLQKHQEAQLMFKKAKETKHNNFIPIFFSCQQMIWYHENTLIIRYIGSVELTRIFLTQGQN